ncbi:unnamed protein product [Amoebophrya sp. A25]|nr:unnamed protein product [Amoebophrya sp. A25]|eukprot:GSA25T00003550001.1
MKRSRILLGNRGARCSVRLKPLSVPLCLLVPCVSGQGCLHGTCDIVAGDGSSASAGAAATPVSTSSGGSVGASAVPASASGGSAGASAASGGSAGASAASGGASAAAAAAASQPVGAEATASRGIPQIKAEPDQVVTLPPPPEVPNSLCVGDAAAGGDDGDGTFELQFPKPKQGDFKRKRNEKLGSGRFSVCGTISSFWDEASQESQPTKMLLKNANEMCLDAAACAKSACKFKLEDGQETFPHLERLNKEELADTLGYNNEGLAGLQVGLISLDVEIVNGAEEGASAPRFDVIFDMREIRAHAMEVVLSDKVFLMELKDKDGKALKVKVKGVRIILQYRESPTKASTRTPDDKTAAGKLRVSQKQPDTAQNGVLMLDMRPPDIEGLFRNPGSGFDNRRAALLPSRLSLPFNPDEEMLESRPPGSVFNYGLLLDASKCSFFAAATYDEQSPWSHFAEMQDDPTAPADRVEVCHKVLSHGLARKPEDGKKVAASVPVVYVRHKQKDGEVRELLPGVQEMVEEAAVAAWSKSVCTGFNSGCAERAGGFCPTSADREVLRLGWRAFALTGLHQKAENSLKVPSYLQSPEHDSDRQKYLRGHEIHTYVAAGDGTDPEGGYFAQIEKDTKKRREEYINQQLQKHDGYNSHYSHGADKEPNVIRKALFFSGLTPSPLQLDLDATSGFAYQDKLTTLPKEFAKSFVTHLTSTPPETGYRISRTTPLVFHEIFVTGDAGQHGSRWEETHLHRNTWFIHSCDADAAFGLGYIEGKPNWALQQRGWSATDTTVPGSPCPPPGDAAIVLPLYRLKEVTVNDVAGAGSPKAWNYENTIQECVTIPLDKQEMRTSSASSFAQSNSLVQNYDWSTFWPRLLHAFGYSPEGKEGLSPFGSTEEDTKLLFLISGFLFLVVIVMSVVAGLMYARLFKRGKDVTDAGVKADKRKSDESKGSLLGTTITEDADHAQCTTELAMLTKGDPFNQLSPGDDDDAAKETTPLVTTQSDTARQRATAAVVNHQRHSSEQ